MLPYSRRLVYLKELVEHALEHKSVRTPIDSVIAIHNMHMACEWLFRIVLDDWNSNFPNLLNRVVERYKPLEQFVEDLNQLNNLRNTIQHREEFFEPDPVYVEILCDAAEQAIKVLISEHFGINYDDLSLVNSIVDDDWRVRVKRAERAYLERDYRNCLDQCSDIIADIIAETARIAGEVTSTFTGTTLAVIIDERYRERYFMAECQRLAEDLGEAIKYIGYASTTMQFLSLDEKLQFVRVSRILDQYFDNQLPEEELPQKAKVVLDFTIRLATKLSRLRRAYNIP